MRRLYEMAQKELADRKRADELLRKSEREKQAILNGLKDVTVEYLDPELRIIWRNNATPGGVRLFLGRDVRKILLRSG